MGKRAERTRRLPEFTTKAKIIFGLVGFFFFALIAVFIGSAFLTRQAIDSKGYDVAEIRKDFESKSEEERMSDAIKTADAALKAGNEQKAQDIYEQAVAVEKDPLRKVQMAIDHSLMLSNAGKQKEAIEVAKEAESFSEDRYLIKSWLGNLYAYTKDYNTAADYYKQAGELVGNPSNTTGFDKAYYDRKVQKMQSLAGSHSS